MRTTLTLDDDVAFLLDRTPELKVGAAMRSSTMHFAGACPSSFPWQAEHRSPRALSTIFQELSGFPFASRLDCCRQSGLMLVMPEKHRADLSDQERRDQETTKRGRFMLLKKIKRVFYSIINIINNSQELFVQKEISRLRENLRYKNYKSLIPFGSKVYSQSDEDGIIKEIFARIGTGNKTFVEFGIGTGLENNTLALLFDDWKGLWIDASSRSIKKINKHLYKTIRSGQLRVVESFITTDNINELIVANVDDNDIDLLSVDIDGNDYHVLNSIACVKPRVIIVEYNAKFTPPILFCMEYDESHTWKIDDCYGASLKFLEIYLSKKGYCLVGCNLTGINAFFVREDLVADKFLKPFTAENHYEPARHYLAGFSSGHPPTFKTLERSLALRST